MSKVCDCFHPTKYKRWNASAGDFVEVTVNECYGVKGAPECFCEGDKSKCNYYPPEESGDNEEEELFHLVFRFCGYQAISANDMYIPTARKRKKGGGGFGGAFLRKSGELDRWQKVVTQAFDDEIFYPKSYISVVSSYINNQNIGAKLILKISIPKEEYWKESAEFELYRHDTSNFIKAIEDAIFSNVGIDDKRTIKIEAEKGYNEDYEWYIEAHLVSTSIDNKINVDTRRAKINGEE